MLPTDIHKILAVCFCCCHFFGNYFWPNAKLKVNAVASHPNTEDDDNNDRSRRATLAFAFKSISCGYRSYVQREADFHCYCCCSEHIY